MFNPVSEDYYSRLGLQKESSYKDIKEAFLKAVRQYPPEQDPENYKQIREAYDTLIDQHAREEYDTRSIFGPEIEELEEQIKIAHESKDSIFEIKCLKRLLNIAPQFGIYRNRLGLVLLENDDPDQAYKQFVKALESNPENHIYVLNMGHAERERENFRQAELLFTRAGKMDEDDYGPPRALASLYYYNLDKKTKAYRVLENAILADGKLDFRDLFCIWDKLHFAIFDDKLGKLNSELKRILEIAKNREEKHFAVYLLWEPSIRLYEAKRYNFAAKLLSCARKLDPSDEKLEELYQNSKQNAEILKSVNTVLEKPSVHDFVKHLVSIYVGRWFNEIDEEDWSTKMEEVREVLVPMMTEDPDCSEIKQSLRYLRDYHKRLFKINSNFFSQLIDAPAASRITHKCPKCNNSAIFGIGSYGQYTCPKCNATLLYDENGVTEQKGFIDAVKDLFSDW